ncbi:hypothetical protein GCM10027062_40920 [Nocardioides hungaricus]
MGLLILDVDPGSDHVVRKINSEHRVTLDDVEEALGSIVNYDFDEDPDRGRRLYVWGRAGRRTIFVCLYPVDEEAGQWRLGTAYPAPWP